MEGPPGPQGTQGPPGANGPVGTTGAVGAQGPTGSVTEAFANGGISSLPNTASNWVLVPNSSTSVAVAAGETLYVFSTATIGVTGTNVFFDLDIGYRSAGIGSYSATDDYHSFTMQSNTRFAFPLFSRITGLAAGNYDVALLYRTSSSNIGSPDRVSTVAFSAK